MSKPYIFIIEDDKAIRNLISTTLETQSYVYQSASDASSAIMNILSNPPDLIILDLGLPDMDGVDLIHKIRSWSEVPIIIVSARNEDKDKIEALDAGADDYLTKPFSTSELLARLRVSLRRSQSYINIDGQRSNIFINGHLKIDFSAGCVYLGSSEIHLTPIEYKLICLLAKNVGKVLTHNFIFKEVWGVEIPEDNQSLRVFMATLRKKIECPSEFKLIQTHVGIGYRMIKIEE